jgi:sugar phosphate permease
MEAKWWKWRVCVVLYVSYASCYFGRNSFSSLSHFAVDSGVSVELVGLISTAMALGYSFGKLLATFAVDSVPPTILYPSVITLVGLINLAFSFTAHPEGMILLWFLNGCMHAVAWVSYNLPSCGC